MSLFQLGFHSSSRVRSTQEQSVSNDLPNFMPTCFESELGNVEHSAVVASDVAELADPSLFLQIKKRKTRGKYTEYTPQQRASIEKYACEHSNERARRYFLSFFTQLCESTIRNSRKPTKKR